MSQKHRTHPRGERRQAFADRIRGVPLDRILCVSLDVSKYFHVVMIHNGLGEIITLDIFLSGFDRLWQAMEEARVRTQSRIVLVRMEPTGHYFENIARHMIKSNYRVTLNNSFAVKQNRDQHKMQGEKTDEIDVAAIGDLLRRRESTSYRPGKGLYLRLQQLDRVRLSRVKIERMLKNRILGHLDRIFPGLVLIGDEATRHYKHLLASDSWSCQTLQLKGVSAPGVGEALGEL